MTETTRKTILALENTLSYFRESIWQCVCYLLVLITYLLQAGVERAGFSFICRAVLLISCVFHLKRTFVLYFAARDVRKDIERDPHNS